MNYSVHNFTLDLQVIQAQVSLAVRYGDTGRMLRITITNGGIPYKFNEGCYAVLSAIKPDGKEILNECSIDLNDMAILYTFTEQTASCTGITQCEVVIYGSNGLVIGTPRFVIVVDDRLIYDDSIASDADISAITDYLAKLKSAIEAETARVKAENARVEAETKRVEAETKRVEAENERVKAENERVKAEKTRTTFIPSVSEDGVLSWTNDKGLENPAPLPLIQSLLNKIPQAEGGSF